LSSPSARLPVVEGVRALRTIGHDAVEAFDFTPGPERIATGSLRNLTQVWGAAGGRT
jgi:hypothetical protein